MEALLAMHGLPFTRVRAVDGRLLTPDEIRALSRPKRIAAGFLVPGEIGNFLSHRACWRAAAAGPDDHTLILEDDVHIGADAGAILSRTDWIPADADIVKLETFEETRLGRVVASTVSGREVRRLRGRHLGAAAYIVSRRIAPKLLSMSESFGDPVDHFLFDPVLPDFHSLKVYQLVPALFRQDDNGGWTEASHPALRSNLADERRPLRPRLDRRQKIVREFKRPFLRIGRWLRALLIGRPNPRARDRVDFR